MLCWKDVTNKFIFAAILCEMEIKHLKHNKIDIQKWDACIFNATNSLVYAESWYLNIVSPNWEALVLKDYEYVMPLPVKKKYGFPFLIQPTLTQQLGVFSSRKIDVEVLESFIKKIPYRSVHLNFNEQNPCNKGMKQPNYVLNLNQNYDMLYANYSKNTKRNIKKAKQVNVCVTADLKPKQFLDFYFSNINNNAKPNENLTTNLINACCDKKKFRLYAAYSAEKEVISALGLLESKERLIYLLAASNEAGIECSAMSLIVDNVIQDFAKTNTVLDFEGSKLEGIARFYTGFGATPATYFQIRKHSILQFMTLLKKINANKIL